MRIEILHQTDKDRSEMDPVLEPGGALWAFRVYSGDFCDPISDPDGWFGPIAPKILLRLKIRWMPFLMWRYPFTSRGGYVGFKMYGVNSPNYLLMLPAHEVFEESRACHLSFRPFANLKKG